ncbi:MAG: hypothetical protein CMH61_01305 [Nanoarchaeota archaeon]|nr:hypothetical protein [Nanoarchaeota archaeon]|tara:strand:+ start:4126 stop:5286 length:1161 start_codon:yes stop_codon:yes gene_type:complete
MVELRALHFTDVQDHYDRLEVIRDFLPANDIDAVFFTGDFIEANPIGANRTGDKLHEEYLRILVTPEFQEEYGTAQRRIQEIVRPHIVGDQLDESKLSASEKSELEALVESKKNVVSTAVDDKEEELKTALPPVIHESYTQMTLIFGEIAAISPVYAIMGNHDMTTGYEHLEDTVTFLEKQKSALLEGRNGVQFTLKGDLNTWEIPGFYNEPGIRKVFDEHYIPFESGESLGNIEEKLRTTSGEENRKYRSRKGDVTAWQASERTRLGDRNADIYFTHKLPHCDKGSRVMGDVSGEITLEYSIDAKSVHGGHFHGGQIGWSSLRHVLEAFEEGEMQTTINGEDVPLYLLTRGEHWELNPGEHHFFVTEYDAAKEVERVLVYEFVYE